MKNFLALLLVFWHYAYACGGCRDYSLTSSQATLNINKYEGYELGLSQSIEVLNFFIDANIIASQEQALKESQILRALNTENTLFKQEEVFLLQKLNHLQGIINSIKATNNSN